MLAPNYRFIKVDGKSVEIRCDKCVNGFTTSSENDYHGGCILSSKKTIQCMIGQESHYISMELYNKANDEERRTLNESCI